MTYRKFFLDIFRLLRPAAGLFSILVAAQIIGAVAFGIVDPLVLKYLVDSLSKGDVQMFAALVGVSFVLGTSIRGIDYFSALYSRRLSNAICEQLVSESFDSFCEMPHGAVHTRDDGYFVSRIYDEPAKVSQMATLLASLVKSLVVALSALAVCLYLAWKVALALVVIVPVLVYLARRYGDRISDATVQSNEDEAQLRGGLGKSVEGHKTMQIFSLHATVRKTVDRLLDALLNTLYRQTRHQGALSSLSGLFLSYAELAVIIGAGIQVLLGTLTVGGLFGFTSAFWRVVNACRSLIDFVPKLATLKGQFERVNEFADLRTDTFPQRPTTDSTLFDLRNVTFGYDDTPLFDGLTARLEKGERILLSGGNGSGKSTLGHLAIGLLQPDEGDIAHVELKNISAQLLPFGFVPGSVADNLKLDTLDAAAKEKLMRLAAEFRLDDKLDRMPDSLSQGEQRKLQVLMTLMKPAELYVFDEPLANVDAQSKGAMVRAILRETGEAGVMVIMHGDDRFRQHFDRTITIPSRALGDGQPRPDTLPALSPTTT